MKPKKKRFTPGIFRYLNLHRLIKKHRRLALIDMREEHLRLRLELASDRDRFLKQKLGVVKNLIEYQLELNAVSETQIKIIREFLGEPVMEKIRSLNISIAQSSIDKFNLNQTDDDQKNPNMGEQTRDP